MPPVAEPQRTEIVFIESNVADYQTLLNGVKPGAEVHILDASKDGLAQMAQILAGRSGIDAIHVVSHGSEGSVQLGALDLTSQNLQGHAADLATIGGALSQNADILLYGCDVAKSEAGQAFIANLAVATGADVAASDNLTGSIWIGGDWKLEAQSGLVETAALDEDGYSGLLAAPTLDTASSPTFGSVPEGATNSAGVTVASLVVDGSITDSDGAVEAIAVEAVNTSLGTWQYSIDGGSNWLAIRADLLNNSSSNVGHMVPGWLTANRRRQHRNNQQPHKQVQS